MLSPKSSSITDPANTGVWDATTKGLWLPILVGSQLYGLMPQNFTDLETKLNAVVSGSLQGKQLQATLPLIDRLGPVDASSTGTDGEFSTLKNREGLIEYAMSVLYGSAFWPRRGPMTITTPTAVTWR